MDGTLRPKWGYLPFNGGPRICIGQQYALTEVGYVLVRMVQELKGVIGQNQGPWEESLALTVCVRGGVPVVLVPDEKGEIQ
jgi:cytochrome P450